MKKRKFPAVLRFHKFKIDKQPSEYFFSEALLYRDFETEEDLLKEIDKLSGVEDTKITWALDMIASITSLVDVWCYIEFSKSNITKNGFKMIMNGLQKCDVQIRNIIIMSPNLTPDCEIEMERWLEEHHKEMDTFIEFTYC